MRFYLSVILLIGSLLGIGVFEPCTARAALSVQVDMHEPQVAAGQGYIRLFCPADGIVYHFQIFSITGRLERTITFSDGIQQLTIPQGCYIVRCEKWSKKVIVS